MSKNIQLNRVNPNLSQKTNSSNKVHTVGKEYASMIQRSSAGNRLLVDQKGKYASPKRMVPPFKISPAHLGEKEMVPKGSRKSTAKEISPSD